MVRNVVGKLSQDDSSIGLLSEHLLLFDRIQLFNSWLTKFNFQLSSATFPHLLALLARVGASRAVAGKSYDLARVASTQFHFCSTVSWFGLSVAEWCGVAFDV